MKIYIWRKELINPYLIIVKLKFRFRASCGSWTARRPWLLSRCRWSWSPSWTSSCTPRAWKWRSGVWRWPRTRATWLYLSTSPTSTRRAGWRWASVSRRWEIRRGACPRRSGLYSRPRRRAPRRPRWCTAWRASRTAPFTSRISNGAAERTARAMLLAARTRIFSSKINIHVKPR